MLFLNTWHCRGDKALLMCMQVDIGNDAIRIAYIPYLAKRVQKSLLLVTNNAISTTCIKHCGPCLASIFHEGVIPFQHVSYQISINASMFNCQWLSNKCLSAPDAGLTLPDMSRCLQSSEDGAWRSGSWAACWYRQASRCWRKSISRRSCRKHLPVTWSHVSRKTGNRTQLHRAGRRSRIGDPHGRCRIPRRVGRSQGTSPCKWKQWVCNQWRKFRCFTHVKRHYVPLSFASKTYNVIKCDR